MKLIFADTFYWIALINVKDGAHASVLNYTRRMGAATIITTDEVLTELLAFCASDPQMRGAAAIVERDLLVQADVRVIAQSRASFLSGLELYQARPDKGYSLVDCISMQTMRQEELTEILTGDRHFEQEGFRAWFK